MATDTLVGLRQSLPTLRPAEQRIARAALDSPGAVAELTIAELAERCGTSPASVARFCRTIGYTGYASFRIAMARAAEGEESRRFDFGVAEGDINADDTPGEVARKLAYSEARAVEETAAGLDLDALERAADAIRAATAVEIYGSGSSGLAGQDLQQKLRRIGLTVSAWIDPHLALTSAAVLGPGSVVIGFSHSGRTQETLTAMRTAQRGGAYTIAVTSFPDSPLGRLASDVLTTVSRETRFRPGAMSSRMAQLTVVDILFTRIAQRDPVASAKFLNATHEAMTSRFEPVAD